MKSNVCKLYQLEQLVNNGGDKVQIQELRKELGFPKINNDVRYNFKVDEYIQFKAQGYSDKDILIKMRITTATLVRYKRRAGLTKEKIKELLKEYKVSS